MESRSQRLNAIGTEMLNTITRTPNFKAMAAPRQPAIPARKGTAPKLTGIDANLNDDAYMAKFNKKYEDYIEPAKLFQDVLTAYAYLTTILTVPPNSPEGKFTGSMAEVYAAATSSARADKTITNDSTKGVGITFLFASSPMSVREDDSAYLKLLKPIFGELDFTASNQALSEIDPYIFPMPALSRLSVVNVAKFTTSLNVETSKKIEFQVQLNSAVKTYDNQDRASITFKLNVFATIYFPKEYAVWAGGTSKEEDYIPALFRAQISKLFLYYINPKSKKKHKPLARAAHPLRFKETSDSLSRKYLIPPIKKTNADGLTILISGNVLWIPEGEHYKDFSDKLKNLAEGDTNLEHFANMHIGTDWVGDKLYTTTANAEIAVTDLLGSRKLDEISIGFMFERPISAFMYNRIAAIAARSNIKLPKLLEDVEVRWENLLDVPVTGSNTEAVSAELQKAGPLFIELYNKLDNNIMSAYDAIQVRPWITLIGKYGKDRAQYSKLMLEQRATNSALISPDAPTQFVDLKGVDAIMPHQKRVMQATTSMPKGLILDVDAGGGKTLAYIHDITVLMANKKIKRPCIIMPRNLLPQFATEMSRFSKGALRPFILNTRVWAVWLKRIKTDPANLHKLLASQPEGTVFLVDINWLGLHRVTVHEESEMFIYPNAAVLGSLGFDYVAVDESQRAKNLKSNRTMGTNVVAANAEYRRIGSGTVLHNTAKDLLGQASILNPLALADVKAELLENQGVDLASIPAIRQGINTFARHVRVNRREWAHLLPTLHEQVWTCRMSQVQQDFYDKVITDLLSAIQADPKFQKMIKLDKEKAEKQMLMYFKRELARVEIWLNAPDSDYNENQYGNIFKEYPDVKMSDLRSPKLDQIHAILNMHFNGAKNYDRGDGVKKDFAPNPGKVLIVGYNKAVSVHIMKNLKYANIALHYTAGDDAVIKRFKEDDNIKILVADETAMQEGHNLQMLTRIIRLQTIWTPGGQEQLLARMLRPDVPDKNGNIKYAREDVDLDWIVIEPSIEMAKMARLLGKYIENGILTEIDYNPKLKALVDQNEDTFNKLYRVSMDLDFIRDANLQTAENLGIFFNAYRVYKTWENNEFAEEKTKLRAELEKKVGRKLKPSELGPMSMIKIDSAETPALKHGDTMYDKGYLPWVEGWCGVNYSGIHLEPITLPPPQDDDEDEGESDDGEENAEDNITVEIGEVVATEFGLGYVTAARANAAVVYVKVPGFMTAPVKVMRFRVLAATTPEDKAALALLLKTKKQVNTVVLKEDKSVTVVNNKITSEAVASAKKSAATLGKKAAPAPTSKPDKTGIQRLLEEPEEEVEQREISVALFNGTIALVTMAEDDASDKLLSRLKFDYFGRNVRFEIRNPKAYDRLVASLQEDFYIPAKHLKILNEFGEIYTKRRENVAFMKAQSFAFHNSWVREQKVPAKEKNELRFYPVVEDKVVYLYVNADNCKSAIKLRGYTVTGVKPPVMIKPSWIKFATSRQDAWNTIKELDNRGMAIADMPGVKENIRNIRG